MNLNNAFYLYIVIQTMIIIVQLPIVIIGGGISMLFGKQDEFIEWVIDLRITIHRMIFREQYSKVVNEVYRRL